jgi:DNA-binding protein WhiA
MRNQVNRQVNCETANLGKTIDASVRQVELIEALITRLGIGKIPLQLRELALLRIDHPDSTLKELGALMNPPLTKSGVAYRMRKLEIFAEENLYGA